MKIFPISDIHNEFRNANSLFNDIPSCDIIVIAGDLNVGARSVIKDLLEIHNITQKVILYVPGNHEYYDSMFKLEEKIFQENIDLLCKNDIYYLNNNYFIQDDVKFIGTTGWVDGSYRKIDPYVVKSYYADPRYIYDFNELINEQKKDEGIRFIIDNLSTSYKNVIITHWLPNPECISPRYYGDTGNVCFANDWLAAINGRRNKKNKKIPYWIHGHSHDAINYLKSGIRYIRNPVGYPRECTETQFNINQILEI